MSNAVNIGDLIVRCLGCGKPVHAGPCRNSVDAFFAEIAALYAESARLTAALAEMTAERDKAQSAAAEARGADAAEIGRLRERLEMGWGTDGNGNRVPIPDEYDGIYCRDETIRLQDEQIDRLRAWRAKHVKARAKLEAWLRKLKRKLRHERKRVAAAYQIVGALSHLTDTFGTPDVQRALDYLSGSEIEGPILPWPREKIARSEAPRIEVEAQSTRIETARALIDAARRALEFEFHATPLRSERAQSMFELMGDLLSIREDILRADEAYPAVEAALAQPLDWHAPDAGATAAPRAAPAPRPARIPDIDHRPECDGAHFVLNGDRPVRCSGCGRTWDEHFVSGEAL